MSKAVHIRFLARARARTMLAEKCEHESRLLQQASSLQGRVDGLTLKFATAKEKNRAISQRVAALTETNKKLVLQIKELEPVRHAARTLEEEKRELMKRLKAFESDPRTIAAQSRKQRELRESLEETNDRLVVATTQVRQQRSLIARLENEKADLTEAVGKGRSKAGDTRSTDAGNRDQNATIRELHKALEESDCQLESVRSQIEFHGSANNDLQEKNRELLRLNDDFRGEVRRLGTIEEEHRKLREQLQRTGRDEPHNAEGDGVVSRKTKNTDVDIRHLTFAVIDFETTGRSRWDRVVEVAVFHVDMQSESRMVMHRRINPQRPVGDSINFHGLSDEILQGEPVFAEYADELISVLSGRVITAWNAPFDIRFLRYECERVGRHVAPPYFDLQWLPKRLDMGERCRLEIACKRYGVELTADQAHRADEDTRATAEILKLCLKKMERDNLRTFGEIGHRGFLRNMNGPSDDE